MFRCLKNDILLWDFPTPQQKTHHLETKGAPREIIRHVEVSRDRRKQVSLQLTLPEAEELVPPVVTPDRLLVAKPRVV